MPAPTTPIEPPIRAELRIQTVCLAILTVVAVGFALWWLQPVAIPFVVAAFLAIALMPLVDSLEKWVSLPRTVAACAALILALLALFALGALASTAVIQITSSATQYETQVEEFITTAAKWPPFQWMGIKSLEMEVAPENNTPKNQPDAGAANPPQAPQAKSGGAATPDVAKAAAGNKPSVEVPRPPSNPFSFIPESAVQTVLLGTTNAVLGVVKQSVIVLVFLFFLLLSSVKRDRPIGGAWGEMESRIRAYIVTMTTLSAATGAAVGASLALFGVQAAVLFGLLTFLFNFIPNVGSFISIVLTIPIVWLSPGLTLTHKILAIVIPAAIQFVIGTFIQPKLMGDHMKLHPVVIVISLIFWGMLWGIVGAFLAVPITSIIRIACDRHPLTKPVANLMAGRLDALREEPPLACETPA